MSVQTSGDLSTEINANLADNSAGDITPADIRGVVTDLNDSMFGTFQSTGEMIEVGGLGNNIYMSISGQGSNGGNLHMDQGYIYLGNGNNAFGGYLYAEGGTIDSVGLLTLTSNGNLQAPEINIGDSAITISGMGTLECSGLANFNDDVNFTNNGVINFSGSIINVVDTSYLTLGPNTDFKISGSSSFFGETWFENSLYVEGQWLYLDNSFLTSTGANWALDNSNIYLTTSYISAQHAAFDLSYGSLNFISGVGDWTSGNITGNKLCLNSVSGNLSMTSGYITGITGFYLGNTGTMTLGTGSSLTLQSGCNVNLGSGGGINVTGSYGLKGYTDATNAQAGYLGEVISGSVLSGSAVNSTNNSVVMITSISLTAGDWDVIGQVSFHQSGTVTGTGLWAGLSTGSLILPTWYGFTQSPTGIWADDISIVPSPQRLNVTGATTVYLNAKSTWSGGQMKGYGYIIARRAR